MLVQLQSTALEIFSIMKFLYKAANKTTQTIKLLVPVNGTLEYLVTISHSYGFVPVNQVAYKEQ